MRELIFRSEHEQRVVQDMAREMCIANGDDPYEDPENLAGSILHWRPYFEYQALLQYRAYCALRKHEISCPDTDTIAWEGK